MRPRLGGRVSDELSDEDLEALATVAQVHEQQCESCKQCSPDVAWRTCPFALEIHSVEEWSWMCDYCVHQRFMDT